MFSKAIKASTFIICTAIFGSLVYLFFFSNEILDLKLYFDNEIKDWNALINTSVISGTSAIIKGYYVLYGAPLALFFGFVMRSIDWRHEKRKDGCIWVFGAIVVFVFTIAMYILIKHTGIYQKALYGIFLAVNYFNCLLTIFVPQGQMESDGSTSSSGGSSRKSSSGGGYEKPEGFTDSNGDFWHCPGGGCM